MCDAGVMRVRAVLLIAKYNREYCMLEEVREFFEDSIGYSSFRVCEYWNILNFQYCDLIVKAAVTYCIRNNRKA